MQPSPLPAPLILSLRLDDPSFALLNALRTQHFPRERNHLSAHLTLFHALPGEEEARLERDLAQVAGATNVLALSFPRPRFLGRGVAIEIECPELLRLRGELARRWRDLLGAQDAQGWKHPHVTIQNKVAPEKARALFEELSQTWQPRDGQGVALQLWRYLGGPWGAVGQWKFSSNEADEG